MPEKKQLKEAGSQFESTVCQSRESMAILHLQSGSREEYWCSACFLLLIQSGTPACEDPLICSGGLPLS